MKPTAALAAACWHVAASTVEARQAGKPDPYDGAEVSHALSLLAVDLGIPAHEVYGVVEQTVNERD